MLVTETETQTLETKMDLITEDESAIGDFYSNSWDDLEKHNHHNWITQIIEEIVERAIDENPCISPPDFVTNRSTTPTGPPEFTFIPRERPLLKIAERDATFEQTEK